MVERRTRQIVIVGILAALAWVVSTLSFPILPWVPFLKVDFSDIPILLGMYIYGPITGIAIAAVRSLLSYVSTGGEAGFPIGDTAAFISSLAYTLPVYYFVKSKISKAKTIGLGGLTATLSLTTVLTFLNWLVIAPLYVKVMGFSVGPMREYLTVSVIPFNIAKGLLVSVVFFGIFYKLYDYLEKVKKNDSFLSGQISEVK